MYRLPRAFRLRQQHITSPRSIRLHQRRPVSRIAYTRDGQPVRYQTVRLKGPGLTMRRIATIGLYTGAVYAYLHLVWQYIGLEVSAELEEYEDDEDAEYEEGEYEDEGDGRDEYIADEDSLFIPLTWATKLPRTFYKGSDPEWQEFIKVAKDKALHKKLQDELVQVVFSGSVKHPILSKHLGQEPKVGKYWLDMSFPDGPPQEYLRGGIEIADDYITWSRQVISAEEHWRMMRTLWPKPAFDSLWATGSTLVAINYRRVMQRLGWQGNDPTSIEAKYQQVHEMMQKKQQPQEKRVNNAHTEPESNSDVVVGSTTTAPQSQSSKSEDSATAGDGNRLPWQIAVPLPPTTLPLAPDSLDNMIAMHVFSSTLSKSWNPKKSEPPRGSFVVQGLVEIRGSRGRALIDVQSCYDPRVRKYVAVNAGVRNLKKWNQSPRGGR